MSYYETTCDACKFNERNWDEEPCNSCTFGGDSNYFTPAAAQKTCILKTLTECSNQGTYCSECRKKIFKYDFSNTMKWRDFKFCPYCGAKIVGNEIL